MDWFQHEQTWKDSLRKDTLSWVWSSGTGSRCKDGACYYFSMKETVLQEYFETIVVNLR